MKIAIVHEFLNQLGGLERTLQNLCDVFPDAAVYALLHDEVSTRGAFTHKQISESFIGNIPRASGYHRAMPFLYPLAAESLDLREYDVVISNSVTAAKGVILKPGTLHICYCSSPTRYLWDDSVYYLNDSFVPALARPAVSVILSGLRIWDRQAAQRPDRFIANSQYVRRRIAKYYRRDAQVIYPPVDISAFSATSAEKQEYYLMVGRLVEYKRFDLGIQACRALKRKLKIVGTGPDYTRLKALAGPDIEFLGHVGDQELRNLFAGARAFLFPQEEDFGIVQVEAIASGCPVVAYRAGGALEVIQEGVNGIFFDSQAPDLLTAAMRHVESIRFSPASIRQSALPFDAAIFRQAIKSAIGA